MNYILNSKAFRIFLLVAFVHLLVVETSTASGAQPSIQNIRHTQENSKITITFDLLSESNSSYTLNLVMLKTNDPAFRYIPHKSIDEAGWNVATGKNRQIEWDTKEEFPDGLISKDYYFKLQVMEETESSISPWVWVGAAVLVGGAVYFLVKKDKEKAPGEFPQPPGRP